MTLAYAVIGAVAVALFVRRFARGYASPSREYSYLKPREIDFILAATDATFPKRSTIPVSGADVDAPRYIDRWFETLDSGKRFQIRMLLLFFEQATLIWWAPGLRGWRRFSSLSLHQRIEVMRAWYGSRFFVRRLVFTALRAVLGMAYLGHPATMRFLRVAPYDFESPILEADLLYPPIGMDHAANPYTEDDLTPPSDGTPIDLDSPVHPDYAEPPL